MLTIFVFRPFPADCFHIHHESMSRAAWMRERTASQSVCMISFLISVKLKRNDALFRGQVRSWLFSIDASNFTRRMRSLRSSANFFRKRSITLSKVLSLLISTDGLLRKKAMFYVNHYPQGIIFHKHCSAWFAAFGLNHFILLFFLSRTSTWCNRYGYCCLCLQCFRP